MNKEFEKILERLEELQNNLLSQTEGDADLQVGVINGVMYSRKIVQEVAEEYKGGWIPCSERFPGNDGHILLSFENVSIPLVGRYEEDEQGGAFYVGDDDESCISSGKIVNAWMTLPETYKEEKNE